MKVEWLDRTALELPFLTLCLSEQQYLSAVKHLKVANPSPWLSDKHAACVHTFDNKEGGVACVVCLAVVPDASPINVAASLAHEAVHVWQVCRKDMGEQNAGDEIEAYAIQNIVAMLFKSYVKQTQEATK